ncbi:MAG: hypothetical protein J0I06_18715, partial [Planctomycetes bacterium]|nr:hypothetical protein [Planctomycetota bacterium]
EFGPVVIGPGTIVRDGVVLSTGARIGSRILIGHNCVTRRRLVIGDDTVKVLARVPKLVSVAFYRTSRITDASLGLLAGHPALVDVQLQVTGVTKAGIKHLATLRAVRQLALWVPDADEWLADLAPLTELTRLEVSAGGPGQMTERGIPHLKPFTRLRRLTLYGRNVTDAWLPQLAAVNPFPELEDLALRDTAVDGSGLADLGKLPRLDWISLNESRVTDEGLESLVKIPRLGWLMLNSTTIGNEGLRAVSKCPNLQNLMLRDNRRVTDRGMAHLAACTKLTDLDLTNTAIGDAGVHELIACKALKRLTLDGTQVTAKGIAELKDKLPGCVVIHGK